MSRVSKEPAAESYIFQTNSLFSDRAAILIQALCEEHDLGGIMKHVFDDNESNWKLSSTTRSCSLLRRSLAWCKVLTSLASKSWEGLPVFFNEVSSFDPDSATWICEQLDEAFGKSVEYTKPVVNLYASVMLSQSQTAVRILAASNLASILEETLSSQPEKLSQVELPFQDLAQSFQPQKDFENWNRQATDAGLRLQGCFLAIHSSAKTLDFAALHRDIHNWIIKLRSALSEETVRIMDILNP